jgi:hypothetical protein
MKKSAIVTMPEYFDRYINLVGDMDVVPALDGYGAQYLRDEQDKFAALGDKVYAPGKWTVKDTIQHLIDCERVFAYRAMRIARTDKTPLPGFDENLYAETSAAKTRLLSDVLAEYDCVRQSSIMLFKSFSDKALLREGTTNGKAVSVLAIGFIIAGHTIHHMNILKERYYPL